MDREDPGCLVLGAETFMILSIILAALLVWQDDPGLAMLAMLGAIFWWGVREIILRERNP